MPETVSESFRELLHRFFRTLLFPMRTNPDKQVLGNRPRAMAAKPEFHDLAGAPRAAGCFLTGAPLTNVLRRVGLLVVLGLALPSLRAEPRRPDILFIAVDDLNDWISPLGGHPQALTPNFDRLARQSVLFTNAHCVAPSCGPVRAAIMSTHAGHTWLVESAGGKSLGHFITPGTGAKIRIE